MAGPARGPRFSIGLCDGNKRGRTPGVVAIFRTNVTAKLVFKPILHITRLAFDEVPCFAHSAEQLLDDFSTEEFERGLGRWEVVWVG